MNRVGLSVDELRVIVRQQARWQRLLYSKGGQYSDASACIERVVVHRPDDPGSVVGEFVLDDGWLAFVPKGRDE